MYWYNYNRNNHDNHHIDHNYINHNHDYHNDNNHDHNNNNHNNNYNFNKMRKRLDGGWEQVFLLCIWSGKLLDCSHIVHRAWRDPCHH